MQQKTSHALEHGPSFDLRIPSLTLKAKGEILAMRKLAESPILRKSDLKTSLKCLLAQLDVFHGFHVFPPESEYTALDATTDQDVLSEMWKRWPNSSPAIATGSQFGIVAIRDDPRFFNLLERLRMPKEIPWISTWQMSELVGCTPSCCVRENYSEARKAELARLCRISLHELERILLAPARPHTWRFWKVPTIETKIQVPEGYDLGLSGDGAFIVDTNEWIKPPGECELQMLPTKLLNFLIGGSDADRAAIQVNQKETSSNTRQSEKKSDALTLLRRVFRISLRRVIKRGATDSIYEFELEDGLTMPIGTTSELVTSPRKLQVAFADRLGIALPKTFTVRKKDEDGETINRPLKWEILFQAILDAAEIIETSTEEEETLGWLYMFLNRSSVRGPHQEYLCEPFPVIDYNDKPKLFATIRAIKSGSTKSVDRQSTKGFITSEDQRCYLHVATFARYITFNSLSAERLTPQKLSVRLTRLGFHRQEVGARQGANVENLKLYVSPANFLESL